MSNDIGPDEMPEEDPREPTGKQPEPRTRASALVFAIIGVIVLLAVTGWWLMRAP